LRRLIVPIFLPHAGCAASCVFCDQSQLTAAAGVPDDARLRIRIEEHLESAQRSPRRWQAREIALYGGTFTGLSAATQERLLRAARPFVDAGRVDGLRVSTHPSGLDAEAASRLARHGVTTVELGLQSMDDRVLATCGRGATAADAEAAAAVIHAAGLTLGIQLMPGLPGADAASDLDSTRAAIALAPEQARLYPTLVLAGTPLEAWTRDGRYAPLSVEAAVARTAPMLRLLEDAGVEILRVGVPHDAPTARVVAGPSHPALGELIRARALRDRLAEALASIDGGGAEVILPARYRSLVDGHGGQVRRYLKERFPEAELAFEDARASSRAHFHLTPKSPKG
jgi:histone acetyltransferase (RNA polymerase elongator complex component)